MNLEIISAADEAGRAVIGKLSRFYVYDMAEHAGWPFEADGDLTVGDHFEPYWGRARENDEHPWPAAWKGFSYLIKLDGNWAGFALVNQRGDAVFDMGEFFVARQLRRTGIGKTFATAMFDTYRGAWTVREMLTNVKARKFWVKIIGEYMGGDFTDGEELIPEIGKRQFIQRFNNSYHPGRSEAERNGEPGPTRTASW